MSTAYICAACGVQFAEAEYPPERCPICEDSRGFGEARGKRQRWTSLAELRTRHRNCIRPLDSGVISIASEPAFGVGQHCLLLRAAGGNVLWDCITLLDDATLQALRELGGISAIAISHPHFYASMVEWSRAFGGVPIHVHAADRQWVVRGDPAVRPWEGERLRLSDELTLVHCGGHFAGAAVLHWAGRDGRPGSLMTGDTIHALDRENVTFMHNYPKQIPLSASAVRGIARAVAPLEFERVYGCWPQSLIPAGGKRAVLRSAERYITQVAG